MDMSFISHVLPFFESQHIPITFNLVCKEWYFLTQEYFLSQIAHFFGLQNMPLPQLYNILQQLNTLQHRDSLSLEYAFRKSKYYRDTYDNYLRLVKLQMGIEEHLNKSSTHVEESIRALQEIEEEALLAQKQHLLKNAHLTMPLSAEILNHIKENIFVKRYDTSERHPYNQNRDEMDQFWNVSYVILVPPCDLFVLSSRKEVRSHDSDIRLNDRLLLENRSGLYTIYCNEIKHIWRFLLQNFPFRYNQTLMNDAMFDYLAIGDQMKHTLLCCLNILFVLFDIFQLNMNQSYRSLFDSFRQGRCIGNVRGIDVVYENNAYTLR